MKQEIPEVLRLQEGMRRSVAGCDRTLGPVAAIQKSLRRIKILAAEKNGTEIIEEQQKLYAAVKHLRALRETCDTVASFHTSYMDTLAVIINHVLDMPIPTAQKMLEMEQEKTADNGRQALIEDLGDSFSENWAARKAFEKLLKRHGFENAKSRLDQWTALESLSDDVINNLDAISVDTSTDGLSIPELMTELLLYGDKSDERVIEVVETTGTLDVACRTVVEMAEAVRFGRTPKQHREISRAQEKAVANERAQLINEVRDLRRALAGQKTENTRLATALRAKASKKSHKPEPKEQDPTTVTLGDIQGDQIAAIAENIQ